MRLSDQDASFLYTETASGPMQTAGIMIIDGEVPFDEIYAHYAARVHLVPRLRQRLVFVPMNLAHPKWVDDPDFNVANHVVHHPIPEGTSLEDAMDLICDLNEGLMDRSIPLWKFHVVTGVPGTTLVLQQAHHAMVDGASAVQMSTVLFDYDAEADPPEPPGEWRPPPVPGAMELMTEAMQENAEAAMSANPLAMTGDNMAQHMQKAMDAMGRFVTEPAVTAPWNASVLGPKRRLQVSSHAFTEFREIRRALGGTINDVVLTAVTEGAARYLEAHEEYTDNQRFRVMCPVNVRTEGEGGDMGNRVSAIFPMFPAFSMSLPERHERVCEETESVKNSGAAQAMTALQENSVSIPPMTLAPLLLVGTPFDPTRFAAANPPPVPPKLGARPPSFGINFVLTNVPGVQVPQYIAGRPIRSQAAIMMMGGNLGLGIAVGSFNQQMIFNLTADPRLLPDLDVLNQHICDAFHELLEIAREKNGAVAA